MRAPRVRHDLAWLALICVGLALVYSTVSAVGIPPGAGRLNQPAANRPRMVCYVQTSYPVSVVCPDGEAYWHPIGSASRVPPVPER